MNVYKEVETRLSEAVDNVHGALNEVATLDSEKACFHDLSQLLLSVELQLRSWRRRNAKKLVSNFEMNP